MTHARAPLAILPSAAGPALHRVDGDEPSLLRLVPNTLPQWRNLSPDQSVLGALDAAGRHARLWRIEESALVPLCASQALPAGRASAIAAVANGEDSAVLYVATRPTQADEAQEHMLWALRAGQDPPSWQAIEIPKKAQAPGKTIDALLVADERLLAIDDMVLPKWNLVYDISDPAEPSLRHAKPLQAHDTYEQVHAAAMGEHWLAIASSGVNHGLESRHLSVLGRRDLKERLHWTVRQLPGGAWGGQLEVLRMAFGGNWLFLAGGELGLGMVELPEPKGGPARDWEALLESETPSEGPPIAYQQLEAPVVDVVTAPGVEGCFAVFAEPAPGRPWKRVLPE